MSNAIFKTLIKIPDFVTMASTTCGVLSIFASISRWFDMAAVLLIAAVLFDRLDGKMARLLGLGDRAFGKELDSLSDAIAFAAAPAVFGYLLGLTSPFAIVILVFFVCAGILRLARFNVIKTEEGYYQGMNITYNGLIFPLAYFFMKLLSISESSRLSILPVVYLISSVMMLSSIKWKKI